MNLIWIDLILLVLDVLNRGKYDNYKSKIVILFMSDFSLFPIATLLQFVAMWKLRAEDDVSNINEYQQKHMKYVAIGERLLNEIESDHLSMIYLELPTDGMYSNPFNFH